MTAIVLFPSVVQLNSLFLYPPPPCLIAPSRNLGSVYVSCFVTEPPPILWQNFKCAQRLKQIWDQCTIGFQGTPGLHDSQSTKMYYLDQDSIGHIWCESISAKKKPKRLCNLSTRASHLRTTSSMNRFQEKKMKAKPEEEIATVRWSQNPGARQGQT